MIHERTTSVPEKSGWYITKTYKFENQIDPNVRYLGPYTSKISAVTDLREIIQSSVYKMTNVTYKVERYIVTSTLDKNAGSWSPKEEDFRHE